MMPLLILMTTMMMMMICKCCSTLSGFYLDGGGCGVVLHHWWVSFYGWTLEFGPWTLDLGPWTTHPPTSQNSRSSVAQPWLVGVIWPLVVWCGRTCWLSALFNQPLSFECNRHHWNQDHHYNHESMKRSHILSEVLARPDLALLLAEICVDTKKKAINLAFHLQLSQIDTKNWHK